MRSSGWVLAHTLSFSLKIPSPTFFMQPWLLVSGFQYMLLMWTCFSICWERPYDSGGHIFFHMKTKDMWYNEYICPPQKKSKTGGHHTFNVRGLGIYKQFPLCMQRISSFPEGMICVVFLGLRRKGEAGYPCLTQAQETVFSVCIPSAPPLWFSAVLVHRATLAAVSHWEYQWVETDFVQVPAWVTP